MSYETLTITVNERVATLTLNRPQALNAINYEMMMELRRAFDELDARDDVTVVVLRGAGRAFCAGMDLKWSEQITPKERVESNRLGQKTFKKMQEMGKPIFAAVHGYVVGGGLELALGADFIVANENAKLAFPEITLSAMPPYRPKITEDGDPDQPEFGGVAPGWGSIKRLPERIGKARALQMFYTGERLSGEKAYQLGLVNDVYPEAEFEERVAELGRRIGAMNQYNLRLIKELVTHGYDFFELHAR